MSADAEWLAGLKPGDEVAVDVGPGICSRYHVLTVKRRSATQIVCVYPGSTSESKFRAKDGRTVGDHNFSARFLTPFTDEVRASVQRDRDLSTVRYARWDSVPPATLRAICSMLAAPSASPPDDRGPQDGNEGSAP